MKFDIIKSEDVAIIKAGKTLTIFDVEDIENPIPTIPTDSKIVILDLTDTDEIDSFGISIVVRLMSYAKNNNQKFATITKDNKVLFILKIDKLHTIIPIYRSIDEAIENLKS